MSQSPHVFVLGSYVAACSARVDRFPVPGESLNATEFLLEPGGKGFNQAVAMARLGARLDGLIAIGDDLFGALAAKALSRHGLSEHMLIQKDGISGAGVGLIDHRGDNRIAVFGGANALLSAEDVQRVAERVSAADIVTAQFEIGDAPIAAAFRIAKGAGARTMLNPSPYRPIAPEILANLDYLILNASEFGHHSGAAREHSCEDVLRELPLERLEGLVVTLGRDGSWARKGRTLSHIAPFPVRAVDSTGAGDAFFAALAFALANDRIWSIALQEASACGAMVVRRMGVLNALPTRSDLDDFLDAHRRGMVPKNPSIAWAAGRG